MALPRSTVPGAVTKSTGQKFTVTTPASIAAGAVGFVTVNLSSRKFSVGEQTVAWFDVTDNGGGLVIVAAGPVVGNKPTYTSVITFANPTLAAITTRTAVIWVAQ
jgi:hypothetical protein